MDHDQGTPRDGDHVDEDLVDFLERHELGPCADCECVNCRLDRVHVELGEIRRMLADYLTEVSL